FLFDYFKNIKIDDKEEFINEEYHSLQYSNLYYRMSGQESDIINSLDFYQKSKENTKTILKYSDKIDFNNKELLSNSSYKDFLTEFIMNAVRVENPDGNHSSYEFYLHKGLKVIDKWFGDLQINTLHKIVFIDYLIETAKGFKENLNIYEYQMIIED